MSAPNNRKFTHDLHDAEVMDIFLREMQINGLCFDGKDLPLIMDGKTRYVKVLGRSKGKKNSRSGWYNGHLGDFPNGKFGWLHGKAPTYSWSLYNHFKNNSIETKFTRLSDEEVEQEKKKLAQQEKLRKIEEKRNFDFSKALTLIEYHRSNPLKQHPYLNRKKLKISDCVGKLRIYNQSNFSYQEAKDILTEHFKEYVNQRNLEKLMDYQEKNIKYRGFNLIAFGERLSGELCMFQLIFNQKSKTTGKDKHFPEGLIKINSFYLIGEPITSDTKFVIICEGLATAISIHLLSDKNISILAAWDAGNIMNVARQIRIEFPTINIFIASDNDHAKPDDENTGIIYAKRTCQLIKGYMIPPEFSDQIPNYLELSDWDDIRFFMPFDQARNLFLNKLSNPTFIPALYEPPFTSNYEINRFNGLSPSEYLEFNLYAYGALSLTQKGLMGCHFSDTEIIKMIQSNQSLKTIIDRHKDIIHGNIEDIKTDVLIYETFHTYLSQLCTQKINLLASSEPLNTTLRQLDSLQYLSGFNLINVFYNLLITFKDSELVEAILIRGLNETGILLEDEDWQRKLLEKIANEIPDINTGLILSLISTQKESLYWKECDHDTRIKCAVNDLKDQYMSFIDEYTSLTEQCIDIHFTKLPYIHQAVCNVMQNNNPQHIEYFNKLNSRLYEVCKFKIELE